MRTYLGMFFIALATLLLEITLTRLLSVITWYHLAFFAVSTAMLGLTAGATTVYLKPEWFTSEKRSQTLVQTCLGFAFSTVLSLTLLCVIPLHFLLSPAGNFLAFLAATAVGALPFYCSGVVISAVLTKSNLPVNRLYACDLLGAAIGCLGALGGLEVLDAPSLILVCGAVGALAGCFFTEATTSATLRRNSYLAVVGLLILAPVNASTRLGIRPYYEKRWVGRAKIASVVERWNSHSKVAILPMVEAIPQYWGPSPVAPTPLIRQHYMDIDGEAGTTVRQFNSLQDIDHLRYDITAMAYYLRPTGGACIIGVGGGKDLQTALLFGHERVTGVEVNRIFIDLLQTRFRDFAGLANTPKVNLVVDEARSYLSQTPATYSVLQMSLIDTWAATGAGAFSLSENTLYTTEAWVTFWNRLNDQGIFTVSRWHNPQDIGETGRILSLSMAMLLKVRVAQPSQHIAVVTTDNISTLLISKRPFTESELQQLQSTCQNLKFKLSIAPGVQSNLNILNQIVAARSVSELASIVESAPLNYSPPTDENPYFFNMLRLRNLTQSLDSNGVIKGNMIATLTLLVLILSLSVLTVITIVLPLLVRRNTGNDGTSASQVRWAGMLFFSLIGAGFMLVEIALIQKLSVILGHPIYGLGVLLFTIILSTGAGSLLSERLPIDRSPWIYIFPILTAGGIFLTQFLLQRGTATLIIAPLSYRIGASVLLIFPLGLLMGFFFPTGMKLAQQHEAEATPWYWALNGIFGLLSSAIAVFLSIYFGISTNFYLGLVIYALLPLCLWKMIQVSQGPPLAETPQG